jgi:DNA-binding winged helix-turn-helix (wHTH) protein
MEQGIGIGHLFRHLNSSVHPPLPPKKTSMADDGMKTSWVSSFGPFRVTPSRRLVECNGEVVRLGGRAFDVLVYLLEHAGQVVSHRTLLEAVWPGTYVEEGNLRFQMAVLRKALGNGEASYIINVPGRGYCFTAQFSKQDEVRYSPPLSDDAIVRPVSPTLSPANEDQSVAQTLPRPAPGVKVARRTVGAISADGERRHVAEICAKLDDLASAIELAASQVKVLGIDKLSDLLEERWLFSWPGHVVPPRHQALYAMLDWSYQLLPEKGKHVFRHMSVFFGLFDLEAARAVVDKDVETASILAELVSRSLVSRVQSRLGTRYRLLDTTKGYARDRLAEAGEVGEARRRHAIFFTQRLQNLKDGCLEQNLSMILTCEVEDVLAAIIWRSTAEHEAMPCHDGLGRLKLVPVE